MCVEREPLIAAAVATLVRRHEAAAFHRRGNGSQPAYSLAGRAAAEWLEYSAFILPGLIAMIALIK